MVARGSYFKYSKLKRKNHTKVAKKTKSPHRLVSASSCWVYDSLVWTMVWIIPYRLKSPNLAVHPITQGKINKGIAKLLLRLMPPEMRYVELPCHITLTRISPRSMDYDNCVYAFKYIRDFICDHLKPGLAAGRADADKRFSIDYTQETAGKNEYGIKITIRSL